MNNARALIYVVDDDVSVRQGLENLLRSAGFTVQIFSSAQEFLAGARADVPSCLVLDVQLPGLSGLDLQQELAEADVQIPIIFLTGHGDVPMSVRAMKAGALEFLTKPVNDEDLLEAIQQGIARDHRARQRRRDVAQHNFEGIVGTSAALSAVLKQVEVVAPTESTVLLLGETGTGKELIARAILNVSSRSNCPFVKLNCAAIPQGYWKVNCLVTKRELLPELWRRRLAASSWRTGERFFSTKWVTFRWSCSPSCCGCCRSRSLSGWEAREPFASTCG
jgi:DNA-binding NtrC family response regulator